MQLLRRLAELMLLIAYDYEFHRVARHSPAIPSQDRLLANQMPHIM